MERWIKFEDGSPIGAPGAKPQNVLLPAVEVDGVVVQAETTVGCAHWDAETLAPFGWYPVSGAADEETETETAYVLDEDTGVVTPTIADRSAADVMPAAKEAIDEAAEVARMSFVTSGAGQQAVYLSKAEEALAADAEESPDPDDYPLLKASIGIEGDTIADVIAVVKATRSAWLTAAALIEGARLGGKKAVSDASTAAAVITARDTALAGLALIRPS